MTGRCLPSRLTLVAIVTGMLLCLWPMFPAAAQPRSEVADPAIAAEFYSRLEAEGRFSELYAYMHPDAQAIIPEAAVVGWYQQEFAPMGPGVSTVTGIQWVSWTWEVTGAAYPQTAEVSFRQPFANGTVTEDVVRLVAFDGEWRWFFGRTRAFVDEQIARYAGAPVAAAPAASQSGASCDGAAEWWSETYPRTFGATYLAYTFSFNGMTALGEQYLRDYGEMFVGLHQQQSATSPPSAASVLQEELLHIYETYSFAFDTIASVVSGGMNPLAESAALDASIKAFDIANSDTLRLDATVDVFLATCDPIVVFVYGMGEDAPIGVLPGDPVPSGRELTCRNFETQPAAQRFFDASGPGDLYGLDADGDGKACEPGE